MGENSECVARGCGHTDQISTTIIGEQCFHNLDLSILLAGGCIFTIYHPVNIFNCSNNKLGRITIFTAICAIIYMEYLIFNFNFIGSMILFMSVHHVSGISC